MGGFLGSFLGGVLQPVSERWRKEEAVKRELDAHAAQAKLDKALNEWEFYSPEERAAVAPELDKALKQKKGYSADLLGKSEAGYKFLQGALEQQKPIQDLEMSASGVAAKPVSLPGRMSGPETLSSSGEAVPSSESITLPSKPVSLPPLPIEGSDIPRVDQNVLQMPASQRGIAMKDYQTRQKEMLARKSKVGEIGTSPLDAENKEIAIESLYLPPGVLSARERAQRAGSSAPQIGLTAVELVSPDGKQFLQAQTTRTGQLVEMGTGKVIDPTRIAGWTKRHFVAPQAFTNPEGHLDVLNKEELARRGAGTIAGTVPDINVAETQRPVVDQAGYISGTVGSRSGAVRQGNVGDRNRLSPVPLTEAKEMASLSKDEEYVRSLGQIFKPEYVGPLQGRWNDLMANTPEFARKLIGYTGSPELSDFRVANAHLLNAVVKFITGAQMSEQEAERIKREVPHTDQNPEDWKAAYAQTLRNVEMMKQRLIEMGRWTLSESAVARPEIANRRIGAAPLSPEAQQRRGTATPSTSPQIGEHREFPNGNIGVWDGKGWKKVNPASQ